MALQKKSTITTGYGLLGDGSSGNAIRLDASTLTAATAGSLPVGTTVLVSGSTGQRATMAQVVTAGIGALPAGAQGVLGGSGAANTYIAADGTARLLPAAPSGSAASISNKTGACTGTSVTYPTAAVVPYTAPSATVSGLTWVSASNSWQVTSAGVYAINASCHFASSQNWTTHQSGSTNGSVSRAILYKNGAVLIHGRDQHISYGGTISSGIVATVTTTVMLAANDTIQVRAYQDSNGGKTISNAGGDFYFEIVKII